MPSSGGECKHSQRRVSWVSTDATVYLSRIPSLPAAKPALAWPTAVDFMLEAEFESLPGDVLLPARPITRCGTRTSTLRIPLPFPSTGRDNIGKVQQLAFPRVRRCVPDARSAPHPPTDA